MKYRLRTLLLLLAIAPPLIWGGHGLWGRYVEWRDRKLATIEAAPFQVIRIKRASGATYLLGNPAQAPNRPGPPGEWDYQYPPASHQLLDRTIGTP